MLLGRRGHIHPAFSFLWDSISLLPWGLQHGAHAAGQGEGSGVFAPGWPLFSRFLPSQLQLSLGDWPGSRLPPCTLQVFGFAV